MKKRKLLIIVAGLLVCLFQLIINFHVYTIQGTSMEPTLYNGEKAIGIRDFSINRNDIVIVKTDKIVVKRIIGLPGDTVYFNKLEASTKRSEIGQITGKVMLHDNEYFIVGDNRLESLDSRIYGTIKRKQIKGKILRVIR